MDGDTFGNLVPNAMAALDELRMRPLASTDERFLRELIWLAAHWSEASPPPPAELGVDLERYVEGFGGPGDRGVLAIAPQGQIGAAWIREMPSGYGFVADGIGELSMAVLPAFRRRGVGRCLMTRLLADEQGQISLSVDPRNPAVRLYERFGFVRVGERERSWVMLRDG